MKNIREKFISFLDTNKIVYYKSNDEKRIIIPYKGYVENSRVNIVVSVLEEMDILSFGMLARIKCEEDINEIRSFLLDMNSKIIYGNLALANNSDTISYTYNHMLDDEDEFEFELYRKIIIQCLNIHKELFESNYIDDTEVF